MTAKLSAAMLRAIASADWRGRLPLTIGRATLRALAARDLIEVEHRRGLITRRRLDDRYRLTPAGSYVRASLPPATPGGATDEQLEAAAAMLDAATAAIDAATSTL